MYDDGEDFHAALVWWALAVFGHPYIRVLQVRSVCVCVCVGEQGAHSAFVVKGQACCVF